jgi:Zn-finger nucleic acid-binding protein
MTDILAQRPVSWDAGQTCAVEVHRCPKCELVFATRAELEAHLRDEHPGSVEPQPRV